MAFKPADVASEYAKDSKLKPEDVKTLMQWAEKQRHLPKISELQYILFLQSCYYSNEQAKNALDNFFTIRTLCPDIFMNRSIKGAGIQQALGISLISFLPEKIPDNDYQIIYTKLTDCNVDKYVYVDQLKAFDMVTMLWMNLNGTCKGLSVVIDFEGGTFGHLLKINPTAGKKFFYYLQEAMPIRLKEVHIINVPSFIDKLLSVVKPLMKKELFELIHLHPNTIDTIHKYIPKKCLPKDFGGDADSIAALHEQEKQMMGANESFFKMEENQLTDESKRCHKTTDFSKIFGVEGTFKKLELD